MPTNRNFDADELLVKGLKSGKVVELVSEFVAIKGFIERLAVFLDEVANVTLFFRCNQHFPLACTVVLGVSEVTD